MSALRDGTTRPDEADKTLWAWVDATLATLAEQAGSPPF